MILASQKLPSASLVQSLQMRLHLSPTIFGLYLCAGLATSSLAQEDSPSAIQQVASGELYFDMAEEAIYEELADCTPTEVVTKLLSGAAKAKSPADAMYLINFIVWVRDELYVAADDEGLDVPPFDIDLPKTLPLWNKVFADERADGYDLAGSPNTVALQAGVTLESLLTNVEEEDLMWNLWASTGGHADLFYHQRSKARMAKEEVVPLAEAPELTEPDEETMNSLIKEFLDTPENDRAAWLNQRPLQDILAFQAIASENTAVGEQLLKPANRVTNSILDKRGMATKSAWQPKTTSFNKELLDEAIARAIELTKAGKRCTLTVTRQGGMCGVELIEFPLVENSDTLNWELYDGSPVARVVDYAELFGLFCDGAVVASFWSDGEVADAYEEAQWLVSPKKDPPSAERWDRLQEEAKESQEALIDAVIKSVSDPNIVCEQFTLMFWSLPLDKLD